MNNKKINEIVIGDTYSFSKTISEHDVYSFAGICGDLNPLHVNEEYAKNSLFKTRVAHGMLGASLISTILGMYLPGVGTIYLGQNLKFKAPIIIGDTITATVEVVEKLQEKNIVKLRTTVKNQNDKLVIDGEATVIPPK